MAPTKNKWRSRRARCVSRAALIRLRSRLPRLQASATLTRAGASSEEVVETIDDDSSVVAHRNAGHRVNLGEVEVLSCIRGERQSYGGVDQTLSRWSTLDRRRIVGHDVGARGARRDRGTAAIRGDRDRALIWKST